MARYGCKTEAPRRRDRDNADTYNGTGVDNRKGVTWCIRERNGKEGGGKGLLIQEEKSNTLATSNDQFILTKR